MKIERKSRSSSQLPELRNAAAGSRPEGGEFASVLRTADRRIADGEIARLTASVEELGNRLLEAPSMTLAQAYRDAVRAFVKKIVENGFVISNSAVDEAGGQRKVHALVEEIDDHLLQLLRVVLGDERESLQLLHLIGEIKGLLVSLRL